MDNLVLLGIVTVLILVSGGLLTVSWHRYLVTRRERKKPHHHS